MAFARNVRAPLQSVFRLRVSDVEADEAAGCSAQGRVVVDLQECGGVLVHGGPVCRPWSRNGARDFDMERNIGGIGVFGAGKPKVTGGDIDEHRIVRGDERVEAEGVLKQVGHAIA